MGALKNQVSNFACRIENWYSSSAKQPFILAHSWW